MQNFYAKAAKRYVENTFNHEALIIDSLFSGSRRMQIIDELEQDVFDYLYVIAGEVDGSRPVTIADLKEYHWLPNFFTKSRLLDMCCYSFYKLTNLEKFAGSYFFPNRKLLGGITASPELCRKLYIGKKP